MKSEPTCRLCKHCWECPTGWNCLARKVKVLPTDCAPECFSPNLIKQQPGISKATNCKKREIIVDEERPGVKLGA